MPGDWHGALALPSGLPCAPLTLLRTPLNSARSPGPRTATWGLELPFPQSSPAEGTQPGPQEGSPRTVIEEGSEREATGKGHLPSSLCYYRT